MGKVFIFARKSVLTIQTLLLELVGTTLKRELRCTCWDPEMAMKVAGEWHFEHRLAAPPKRAATAANSGVWHQAELGIASSEPSDLDLLCMHPEEPSFAYATPRLPLLIQTR